MSDLVEIPEDRFPHVVAHLISDICFGCVCFFTITRYSFSEKNMRKDFEIRRVFKKFAEKCHLVLIS